MVARWPMSMLGCSVGLPETRACVAACAATTSPSGGRCAVDKSRTVQRFRRTCGCNLLDAFGSGSSVMLVTKKADGFSINNGAALLLTASSSMLQRHGSSLVVPRTHGIMRRAPLALARSECLERSRVVPASGRGQRRSCVRRLSFGSRV